MDDRFVLSYWYQERQVNAKILAWVSDVILRLIIYNAETDLLAAIAYK